MHHLLTSIFDYLAFFPFSPQIIDVYNRSWIFFTDIGLYYFSEFVFIILKDGEQAFGVYRGLGLYNWCLVVLVYTTGFLYNALLWKDTRALISTSKKKRKKKYEMNFSHKVSYSLTVFLCLLLLLYFSRFFMITVYIKRSLHSRIFFNNNKTIELYL